MVFLLMVIDTLTQNRTSNNMGKNRIIITLAKVRDKFCSYIASTSPNGKHMIRKVKSYIIEHQKYQKQQRSAAPIKPTEGGGLEQEKELKRAW